MNLQAVKSRAELFRKGKQFLEKDNYLELRHAKARRENRELATLELPDHSPEFGRRMSRSGDARRAFETTDTSHRLRRALLASVRESVHTQGIENGELDVRRKVKKNRNDARTALVTHRWYGPAIVVGKEKNNVFVSYRGRVTKVAPECLRKASVAEQNELGHYDERESLV